MKNKGFTPHHFLLRETKKKLGILSSKIFNTTKKGEGFTLIEMTITIFIVSIGLLGVYGVFARFVSQISLASSRLTAVYLAQEGIEITRNIRDNNLLEGEDYSRGLDDCDTDDGKFCEIDYDDAALTTYLNSYEGTFLNIDSNNYYSYNSTLNPTKFKRKINMKIFQIMAGEANDEVKVSVSVQWEEKGKNYNIAIQEIFFERE